MCVTTFTGTRQVITSANLGAVTNVDGNEISYSLIRPPRLGRLILANDKNQYEEIGHFSQTQVIISLYVLNVCISVRRQIIIHVLISLINNPTLSFNCQIKVGKYIQAKIGL